MQNMPGKNVQKLNAPTITDIDRVTSGLTKNQKKKLRQKKARKYKQAAVGVAQLLPQQLDEQVEPHHPSIKRLRTTELTLDKNTDLHFLAHVEGSSPRGLVSAEPRQQRPQLSNFNPSIDSVMPGGPVHRVDLTHVAQSLRNLDGHKSNNDIQEQDTPTINLFRVVLPATATESAASVGKPDINSSLVLAGTEVVQHHHHHQQQQSQFSSWPVTALPAAPPLDIVAPLGPNGMRVYVHGNYHRYYGYRLGQAFSEDPRLRLLERPWFANKRCLDVGCNEGLVSLGIAIKFGTRSMIGVDIDEHLIKRACTHLREERSRAVVNSADARRAGVSAQERKAARIAVSALAQTWFVHADFLESRVESESVDCLTALSVTKWIHLHRGDDGLRQFFARVNSVLAPGGLFVLEPQPWRSYRAASSKMRRQGGGELALPSTTYFHRLSDLLLRPENFVDVITEEFGFQLVKRLQPPEVSAKGFEDRHMYLFRKI